MKEELQTGSRDEVKEVFNSVPIYQGPTALYDHDSGHYLNFRRSHSLPPNVPWCRS